MDLEDEVSTRWWTYPSEDLGSVLWTNSKKYKDFKIIIGDQVLRVHKCVLAARSPVFTAMLTSGLTETKSGRLKIQDFDCDTVEKAILFCYSHSFSLSFEFSGKIIWSLLTFGHKYDIQHLVRACLHRIYAFRHGYDKEERKFLITSAVILGLDQILEPILSIFGALQEELVPYTCPYPSIGDALLAQDDTFKDLKIICDDGTEFSVHRCILVLYESPIFAQILTTMAQNGDTSGQLTIDRIKPIVCENAIQVFYTGCITITDESFNENPDLLLGLLEFADRFKVEHLVNLCLQKLDDEKKRFVGPELLLNYIITAGHFESKKILHFILGTFGTQGFENFKFDIKKASKESYWN